jgi:hypothetical protein
MVMKTLSIPPLEIPIAEFASQGNAILTEKGMTALGRFDLLPEGKALYQYWLGELGNSRAARMLSALYEAHPRKLS